MVKECKELINVFQDSSQQANAISNAARKNSFHSLLKMNLCIYLNVVLKGKNTNEIIKYYVIDGFEKFAL